MVFEVSVDDAVVSAAASESFAVPAPEPPVVEAAHHVQIQVPSRHNPKLQAIVERINADEDLYAIWTCSNVNAVDRLGMSDHGPVHVQIVANIGLRLLRLLMSREVVPSVVRNYQLSVDEAEVIVVVACLLHDVGMSIHRDDH